MTSEKAKQKLSKLYPNLKNENSVLWANIINLFEQIHEDKRRYKPNSMKAVSPIQLKFTAYQSGINDDIAL